MAATHRRRAGWAGTAGAAGALLLGAPAGTGTAQAPPAEAPHGQLLQAPDGTLYLLVAGRMHSITPAPLTAEAHEALAAAPPGEPLLDGAFLLVPAAAPPSLAPAAPPVPTATPAPFLATQTAVAPRTSTAPYFATQTAVAQTPARGRQRAVATATPTVSAARRSAAPAALSPTPRPGGWPAGQS